MTTSRRLAALPLLLIGLAALCAALALIPWVVQAQSQEVTPTASATGANPPAKPTNLQASAEHDSVTLTWTASTDQTVTHYAILRRNPDVGRVAGLPRNREQRRCRDQLHRQLGIGVEHLHLPGEVGQPHRRQPVVRLRQRSTRRQRRPRRPHRPQTPRLRPSQSRSLPPLTWPPPT